jgi:phenylacetate-CoA ligase
MHDRILGRSDDMFIFRGVNIYPSHIDEILSKIKEVGSEYQVHLFRKEDGKDYMTLKVERAQGILPSVEGDERLKKTIGDKIKNQIMVSCDIEIVDYGTLPRSERKTKRVFDNRF